jgi:hypothetical protein
MTSKHENTNSPAIGVDIGTSRIVAAQRKGDGFQYSTQLNAYVAVPFSKLTVSVLEKEKIPHAVEDGWIRVHGNESEAFADLMNGEIRRPMTNGVLDAKDPESLATLERILVSLVGEANGTRTVCFSVPAAPLGAQDGVTYHEATVRQILGGLGFQAKSINEGMAVIYAELAHTNYTGIGVSCGAGLCNVAMAYLSVPVLNFSIPKAGDYIDASAAAVSGERATRIRLLKEESFHFNGRPADKTQQVLGVYYDDMIQTLVASLKEAFARTSSIPRISRPVPFVLSGGTALPSGFRERFEQSLAAERFPVAISEVRLAAEPLHTTAKGALVAALSEL